MNENRLLAAILTVALNSKRPRAISRELGQEDWRQVMQDYERFLDLLTQGEPSQ